MSFNPDTLPKVNIYPHSNNGEGVEIIEVSQKHILFNNGIRWMIHHKENYREEKEMYSSYDLGYGDILISGLGFGILALWLANKPGVKSVTVIEINKEIIDLFIKNNKIPDNLTIINDNMITYETNKKYDCLFLDHYEMQHKDWILNDAKKISKRIQHDVFWIWSLEPLYMNKMYPDVIKEMDNDKDMWQNKDYYDKWLDFVKFYFYHEKSLYKISKDQLNLYIKTFYPTST
jgi:hypothetical protein